MPIGSRGRAFGIYGIVLGLAGAAGFLLGGVLVTLDLAGLGWRAVFFVNVPFGLIIMAAAWRIMPSVPRRAGTRLDVPGAIVLFPGLLCLIGPLLFGHDVHWAPWVWLVMAAGVAIIAAFLRLERAVARRGGMPLIDLALLSDAAFMRGLCAAFFFFFANLSFYLVMTLFMQTALQIPPLQAGLVFVPLALTFVIASRHSGARARHRGTLVLIEGCAVQIVGLALLALTVACGRCALRAAAGAGADDFRLRPGAGDGAVVQRGAFDREAGQRRLGRGHVRHHGANRQRRRRRGDRRGILCDRSRGFGAAGAVCGIALFALSIVACAAFLSWMRARALTSQSAAKSLAKSLDEIRGLTAHGLFILQCSNYLFLVRLKKSLTKELPVSLANNVEFLRHLPKLNGINGFGDFGRNLRPGLRSPLVETTGFRVQSRRSPDVLVRARISLQPAPALVVVLHGCGQTAAGYDLGAGWSTLAKHYGFALLMPRAAVVEQRQRLLQLVQSGRHRARQRRSLLDPADDRADGRRSRHRSAIASSSPGFPPAAP